MTIKLNHMQAHGLAEEFAKVIRAENTTMHLRATWGLCASDGGECPYRRPREFSELREVRDAIRSIKHKDDRAEFVRQIRWHLNRLMTEAGSARKWQDYYASVAKHQAEMRERRAA